MKVIFIRRRYREGYYSIEELFHAIAGEMRKHIEVVEDENGTRWDIILDAWRLRKMNADIYHVTGDINYMVLLLPWHKTVLTVTDIGHFLFGVRGLRRWLYKWIWLLWPIRAARAVTSISKATEDNIVEHLGIARSHITTIDCCHSPLFQHQPRPFHRECPVVLQVGTKPHKNALRLIAALRGIPCKLVLIGQLDEPTRQQLAECGTDYENRANLTHEQIAQAYIDCDIVSFVTLSEGFGVPIIEAQASGRPLITANLSPMREVAGDGACLVDPLDVSQIREGILRIIADSDYRDQLVERGLRNTVRYSPATISGQYLDLYRRIKLSNIVSRLGEIE